MKKVNNIRLNVLLGLFVLLASILSNNLDVTNNPGHSFYWYVSLYDILYAIFVTFLLFVCQRQSTPEQRWQRTLGLILAFLFSQFLVLGQGFYATNTFFPCFGTLKNIAFWLFRSIIYMTVIAKILVPLIVQISSFTYEESTHKHNLLKIFVFLCLTKCIALIVFYPCIFDFDAALGMRTYLDPFDVKCDHHPYFVQMVHGFFFNLGESIDNVSAAFAILSLSHILFSSLILIYAIFLFEKIKIPNTYITVTIILFCFLPVYPLLSVYITKDGLYGYMFLFYMLTLFDITISAGNVLSNPRKLAFHALALLFLCLTRPQGFYIGLLTSICLLIAYRNHRRSVLLATVIPLMLYMSFIKLYLPSQDVEPSNKKEMIGNLFQQCIYCYKLVPDEISYMQDKGIRQVIDVNRALEHYDPRLTDNVKNKYKYSEGAIKHVEGDPLIHFRHVDHSDEGKDLAHFFKSWVSLLCSHPIICTESTFALVNGYFYNENQALFPIETEWDTDERATTPQYTFYHTKQLPQRVSTGFLLLHSLPFVGWLFSIPYYTWIIIFCIFLTVFRKDWRGVVFFMPLILSTCLLVFSPVVTGRYIYPQVIVIPVIIIYVLSYNNRVNRCQQ